MKESGVWLFVGRPAFFMQTGLESQIETPPYGKKTCNFERDVLTLRQF
jgi:hypothetical protein